MQKRIPFIVIDDITADYQVIYATNSHIAEMKARLLFGHTTPSALMYCPAAVRSAHKSPIEETL